MSEGEATALWNWHVAQKSRRKLCNFLDHVHECISRRGDKLPQVLHRGGLSSPFSRALPLTPTHPRSPQPTQQLRLKIRSKKETRACQALCIRLSPGLPPESSVCIVGTQCEGHKGTDFMLTTRLCATRWVSTGPTQFATLASFSATKLCFIFLYELLSPCLLYSLV